MPGYCKNDKPFIYTAFSADAAEQVSPLLQALEQDGVLFWQGDSFSNKEKRHLRASSGVLLFVTQKFALDPRFHAIVNAAVDFNQQILCVYLEEVNTTPWGALQLGSQQSMHPEQLDEGFLSKLKSSSLFQHMAVTPIQKRYQQKKATLAVSVPIVSAILLFFTVINPLLIAPALSAKNLAKQWGLTAEELASITRLYVVGDQSFDSTVHSWYDDSDRTSVSFDLSVNNNMEHQGSVPVGTLTSDDLTILSYMPNLEYLCLCGNQIADISPILRLTKLRELDLSANPITSVEGLQELPLLEYLSLTSTDVTDVSMLWENPNLRVVLIDRTLVRDLSGIGQLQQLEHLNISESLVTDPSPVYSTGQLIRLDMNQAPVTQLPDLGQAVNLYLDVDSTYIRDFSPLSEVKSFSTLRLCNVPLQDLLPYIAGKPIQKLLWAGLKIDSLKELAEINITPGGELNLAGCSLTSLDGLAHFQDISMLDLKYANQLTDLTPILRLPSLQMLTVSSDMQDLVERQLLDAPFEICYRND